MKTKNFIPVFSYSIVFILLYASVHWGQDPCPNYSDVLDNGWAHTLSYPHNPHRGNRDEFGVVDLQTPFLLKVDDYPPVKTFPISATPGGSCGGTQYLYFSFDTDDDHLPINYKLTRNEPHAVKTYRLDENFNYVSGWSMTVVPPDVQQVGSPADFVMKYDGTLHDIAWDISQYSWDNIVSNVISYLPQELEVNINGVDQLDYNSSSEYIADINGGSGYYGIYWKVRTLPDGTWNTVQSFTYPENFYPLYGDYYYFYDNEYKYNLTMPSNDIELKVEVLDHILGIEFFDTKVIIVNPDPVTFINHIQSSENYGSLILNENKSDPITSGDSRNLIFGNNYTIRTDELPFKPNWNNTGKTEKHHQWDFLPPLYVLNHNFTFQATTDRTMESAFLSTETATINTKVDGINISGLNIEFRDPWFYYEDASGNWFQSDEFKTYSSPFSIQNNSVVTYGGVFLDQDPTFDPALPNYSVKAPTTMDHPQTGSTHKVFFQNWEGTNVIFEDDDQTETGVVFTSSNAAVTAVLKGQLMSDDVNGISNPGQRKIVRTDNGQYHVVYESMGTVWYTNSLTSDFYGDWSPDGILHYHGKNPAIEFDGDIVKIVFEEYDPQVGGDAEIWMSTYEPGANGIYSLLDAEVVAIYPSSYYGSAKPVISYTYYEIFVAYRSGTTGGIKHTTKWNATSPPTWSGWDAPDDIPDTGGDSKNPSVIGYKPAGPSFSHICIAYEDFGTIYYREADRFISAWRWDHIMEDPIPISSKSGFNLNKYPVISLANKNSISRYLMVSWLGIYNANNQKILPKEQGGTLPLYREAAVVRVGSGTSWGTFSNFSDNVDYTNNGSCNAVYGSIMAWSESDGQYAKYVRRKDPFGYDAITSLSSNGIQPLVSNGSELGNVKALVFNSSTAPYSINRCTNDFTYIPDEIEKPNGTETVEISFGRTGVLTNNGLEFVFNIGDVFLDGNSIRFIERADTLPINSIAELNNSVKSDTLTLDSESELIFSDYYYVLNGERADTSLSDDFNISFRCELVNLSNEQVVGIFEQVNYNKNNLEEYGYEGYLVDCSGIETGNYYLRLVTTVNADVSFSLSDIQLDDVSLEKSKLTIKNFTGESIPAEYVLEQNYPNPFNPTTTIKFQLPSSGNVTLKIYDVLGREVTTLVDGFKTEGRSEVNFNASSLASGVYLYRLNANDYVDVKKMILLK